MAIAYDVLGCKQDDQYRDGITFEDWSPNAKCRETMMDNIVDTCALKGKENQQWHDDELKVPED